MRKRDCSTGSNGAKSSQRTPVKKPLLCKEWLFWIVVVCVRGNARIALQNHNGKSCPAFLEKGGILLKSFTSVSVFTEETPQSAYGCQLPFQGSLLHKLLVCVLVQPCRNRPAEFARCTRCPPGACQRRLLSLPVFCSVGSLMCYSCRRCNIASPERGDSPRGGEMPAGQRGPLSTRGTAVRRWRGSCGIFCLV